MKYKSELIKEIVDTRGHEFPSIHYESECINKWIEEAKPSYPKLCDYESEWLNYIVENPIGKFPYETLTDVTEATVNNVVPYAYKSAILKGQTIDTIIDFTESFTIQNTIKDFNFLFSPKLNKKYMLTLELTDVTPHNGESDYIAVRGVKEDGSYDELTRVTQSYANGIYEIPCEFTKNYSNFRIGVAFKATIVNMKLRGDLISVRMPVLKTTGKNLCDGVREYNGANDVYGTNFIKVEEGKKYGIYQDDKNFLRIDGYSNNKEFVTSITGGNVGLITIPSGVKYIKWKYPLYGEPYNENSKIMIALSDRALTLSDYEPHKSNILTVNEEVELRGIGEVRDELNLLTGEVTERIGDVVLDGSEDWKLANPVSNNNNNLRLYCTIETAKSGLFTKGVISNRFATVDTVNYEGIAFTAGNKNLHISINKTKLDEISVNGFKQWLSQNPVTVQYHLETESIKTVDLTITNQDGENLNRLKPIEGTMYLSTDGQDIKPTFTGEIPVEAIEQNLTSFIME